MKITISGKQVNVGESLRAHIEKRLNDGIQKYLERVTSITVVISRESHLFRADISGNSGTHDHMVIKGRAESEDVYAACDAAIDKIEKQLRRYKRKITNHHKDKDGARDGLKATKYVIPADVAEDDKNGAPLIIAEKATQIETLTVSEAVMRMDLQDLPALLFFNSAHGRMNVVYRRQDGNISWVDPEGKAA